MRVDVAEADWRELYHLCIGFVVPRPIALVSSMSENDTPNVAPFSFYNMVSANPPTVMFCPGLKRDRSSKDTLRNVERTGEFVVATVVDAIAEKMVATAADLPYGSSEFPFAGLTPKPASRVRAPLVAESPVNIECVVRKIVRLDDGPGSSRMVLGTIQVIHVDDGLLTPDKRIDPHKLKAVGRLGGAWYADVETPYEMQVPKPPSAE
ncbi:MAG: flavin reductase family protein [Phycisphaerales bacterium]|nr:flavin reductase family protein [Phycisphaerales bacterium]